MSVITPFGDLKLGDDIGLDIWLAAHNRRHMQYVKKWKTPGGDLKGPVNGDWMLRHTARHVALATLAGTALGSPDTKILALPDKWQSDEQLADWHLLHNRLHTHIERVLKE